MSHMAPLRSSNDMSRRFLTDRDSSWTKTDIRPLANRKTRSRIAASIELLAAAILLFAIGLTAFNAWQLGAPPSSTPSTPASSAMRLTVSNAAGTQLTVLDPSTLEDSEEGTGSFVALPSPVASLQGGEQPPNLLSSSDGSTIVRIEYPAVRANAPLHFTVTVLDGRSGDVRRQFTQNAKASGLYDIPMLSGDGTRLLIPNQPSDVTSPTDYFGWWVFDTTTGQRVSTVLVNDSPPAALSLFSHRFFIDPQGTRLYRFVGVARTGPESPAASSQIILELVVQDLSTGDVIKTLNLPSV